MILRPAKRSHLPERRLGSPFQVELGPPPARRPPLRQSPAVKSCGTSLSSPTEDTFLWRVRFKRTCSSFRCTYNKCLFSEMVWRKCEAQGKPHSPGSGFGRHRSPQRCLLVTIHILALAELSADAADRMKPSVQCRILHIASYRADRPAAPNRARRLRGQCAVGPSRRSVPFRKAW